MSVSGTLHKTPELILLFLQAFHVVAERVERRSGRALDCWGNLACGQVDTLLGALFGCWRLVDDLWGEGVEWTLDNLVLYLLQMGWVLLYEVHALLLLTWAVLPLWWLVFNCERLKNIEPGQYLVEHTNDADLNQAREVVESLQGPQMRVFDLIQLDQVHQRIQ